MKRQRGNASWHFPVFCTGRKAVVMGRCLRLTDSRRWHEDTDSAPGAAGRRSPDSSGASAKFVRQGQVPQRRRRAKASTRMTRARPPAATGRASMASRLSPYCCRTKAAPAKMTPARMILEKMIPARMTLEKMILEMAETPEKMTPVTQTNQMISQKKQRS